MPRRTVFLADLMVPFMNRVPKHRSAMRYSTDACPSRAGELAELGVRNGLLDDVDK